MKAMHLLVVPSSPGAEAIRKFWLVRVQVLTQRAKWARDLHVCLINLENANGFGTADSLIHAAAVAW
jgi:hypothetical protein